MTTSDRLSSLDQPPPRNPAHDRAALAQSEIPQSELVLALLSASPDCVKLFDGEGRLGFMGYSGLCAMEIEDFSDVAGKHWWELWPVEEAERLQDCVQRARAGEYSRFTAFCPTFKGTPRYWDVTVSPVADATGRVSNVLAVSRDVTELVERNARLERALTQSSMLRREVDHRVKNSLGIVSSLLKMQSRTVESASAADALRAASVRVLTIASVHDRLYQSDDFQNLLLEDYLRFLCADIAASLGPSVDLRLILATTEITVAPDSLIALGLIVAELVNNAVRHAGRPDAPVRVDVSLSCSDATACTLVVRDDGPGLAAGFDPVQSHGMGLQVILSMTGKIKGRLFSETSASGGAVFTVQFDPTARP